MTNVTFEFSYSITIKGQACHTHQEETFYLSDFIMTRSYYYMNASPYGPSCSHVYNIDQLKINSVWMCRATTSPLLENAVLPNMFPMSTSFITCYYAISKYYIH